MELRQLTPDFQICAILNGMWQVSGAHGTIDRKQAVEAMFRYVDAGFTTWDLADHYGPAEDLIGEFRRQWQKHRDSQSLSQVQALTKWVPRPIRMTKQIVSDNIQISLKRMAVESLDALQFHWWDYSNPAYLDALKFMTELQQQGKIKHLALTNFDTEHLGTILAEGIPIISNQVQFSIIDRRPEVAMIPFCRQNNVKILAYGTLCGGLLADKYLGQAEPRGSLDTASLRKYKNMIDAWGGWSLFQELLSALKAIADKHSQLTQQQLAIPHIAVRYILDKPQVGGVIIGARLSISEHIQDNLKIFSFQLDGDDRQKIDSFGNRSRNLFQIIGDCGDEYRR
jgi:aryl-alcohol dehydrogenase-like predicted oxidoreductase